ncbi:hypothetical protein [Sphingosinicella sp.]|uniref:hypothetical protein n=1 Tax=Sphingosinicella sp. TaxID=1917971 RepID=UPI004037F237
MNYDRQFQNEHNGPLRAEVRTRLTKIKDGRNWTLAELGEELGFSGAFVSQILNEKNPARVRSKHMGRIGDVLKRLEGTGQITATETTTASKGESSVRSESLAELVRAAHKLGFSVEFKPLSI